MNSSACARARRDTGVRTRRTSGEIPQPLAPLDTKYTLPKSGQQFGDNKRFCDKSHKCAIVVADALVWEGAPPELAEAVDTQYLLRAMIYRGVTSIVAGTEWRTTIDLARTIAAQCR